jgi:hypothetical protein
VKLNVFFTVDVEIWINSQDHSRDRFSDAFKRYVYGTTAKGDYGLPFKLKVLSDYGLKASFFVESLFACKYGIAPLSEIVGLILEAGQEVQLHLHTEWLDKLSQPILKGRKGIHMKNFSVEEQSRLIDVGLKNLLSAGISGINAFRAGNYGANSDTLKALHMNGIKFDSSYNPCIMGGSSGIAQSKILFQPFYTEGVYEYPVSAYIDFPGHYRHAQLGACSYSELTNFMWQALRQGWHSVVIVSHNFELLNRLKNRHDLIVARRFVKLCRFLDKNRDKYATIGFTSFRPKSYDAQPDPIVSNVFLTAGRYAEQAISRLIR